MSEVVMVLCFSFVFATLVACVLGLIASLVLGRERRAKP
jgi:hypothetical protein